MSNAKRFEGQLRQSANLGPDIWLDQARCTCLLQTVSLEGIVVFIAYSLHSNRVFRGKWFVISCWTFIGIAIAWTIAFFFANLLQCVPITSNWEGDGISYHCVDENVLYKAQGLLDILTDGKAVTF